MNEFVRISESNEKHAALQTMLHINIKFTLLTNTTNIQTVTMVGLRSIFSLYAVFLAAFMPLPVSALRGVQLATRELDAIIGNSNKDAETRVSLRANKRLLGDSVSEDSVDEETSADGRKLDEDSVSEDSVDEDSVDEETSADGRHLGKKD